ncbi:hypothetical protein SDC9_208446 [bioreactor metagenome]|uniref:Uncharacterized protein n=1 Tax=bioreactor metagenome TaxID=1076179 RepID=A0A645JAL8_9ZZZZ
MTGFGITLHSDDIKPTGAIQLDGCKLFGTDGDRNQRLAAAGAAISHQHGVAAGGSAVIDRSAHHIHVQKFSQHTGCLKDSLLPPHVNVFRTGIGGNEFGTGIDAVTDSGNIVVPASGPQKRNHCIGSDILT